jgi:hypothetical protein
MERHGRRYGKKPMSWIAALTAERISAYVELALVVLGLLRLIFGVGWRRSLVATAVVAIVVDVFYPDGVRGLTMVMLRPVRAITRYTPEHHEVVEETPRAWPP